MKIYFSDLFGDYLFEINGKLKFVIHPYSLKPDYFESWTLKIVPSDLELVVEL